MGANSSVPSSDGELANRERLWGQHEFTVRNQLDAVFAGFNRWTVRHPEPATRLSTVKSSMLLFRSQAFRLPDPLLATNSTGQVQFLVKKIDRLLRPVPHLLEVIDTR